MYLTLGARKLRRLMKMHRISAQQFGSIAGVNRITLHNALNGATRLISVDFALAVRRASKGAIKAEDWASETALQVDPQALILARLARASKKNSASRKPSVGARRKVARKVVREAARRAS